MAKATIIDKEKFVFERENKSYNRIITNLRAVWSLDCAARFLSLIVKTAERILLRCRSPPFDFDSTTTNRNRRNTFEIQSCKRENIFEKRWVNLRKFYADNGMSDEDIEQIYRHDLLEFNSTRRFMEHNCYLDEMTEDDYEKLNSQDERLIFEKNASRYWWINEIEDETISSVLKELSDIDIEIITMYAYEKFTQEEIAKMLGVSQQAVSKRIVFFRKLMGDFVKTEN